MTNAEAIETLRANYPDACYEQLREAVDAAIEALKARDTARDTISRQAAIEAMAELQGRAYTKAELKGISKAWKRIKQLPSAQPEIIRCRDCKHYYFADNRIPQEQRYVCDLNGDRWKSDDYCSFAERMKGEQE